MCVSSCGALHLASSYFCEVLAVVLDCFPDSGLIGASLSEPHTSGTALRKCVNIRACLLAVIYRKHSKSWVQIMRAFFSETNGRSDFTESNP